MKRGNKYKTSPYEAEGDVLHNKLNITDKTALGKAEARGFFTAQVELRAELNEDTRFDLNYILRIHRLAFGNLYEFAGKMRSVNISKDGFQFPAAMHLPSSLATFDKTILSNLRKSYDNKEQLIEDIAVVHAELLFIHPFRECNGRTARLLANLMAEKAGYDSLNFKLLDNDEMFDHYIIAVQQAAMVNYEPMRKLIALLFQP